jgi:putative effector of murein hydrolase LrgA (UPF0299 family)
MIAKFKLFLQLFKLAGELRKMKKLMSIVDGHKSLIGAMIVVGSVLAKHFGLPVPPQIDVVGYSMLGVGLTHKAEKVFGVISLVLKYGHQFLNVLQAVVDALKKNEKKA